MTKILFLNIFFGGERGRVAKIYVCPGCKKKKANFGPAASNKKFHDSIFYRTLTFKGEKPV